MRTRVFRGRWALLAALGVALLAASAAEGEVGFRPPPLSPDLDPDAARRPKALRLSGDSLNVAVLPTPASASRADSVSFAFASGTIRRDFAVGAIALRPPAVYSPEEWRAALERRSLEEARRTSAVEAVARSSKRDEGSLTKFDLPVKFPGPIGGLIGQGVEINVTGREAISFSGESNFPINQRESEVGGPRRFPDLDMRQQLQINLDGTIGDKIHVLVQHDSETQTPLSNRIKLRYEGTEDEVIRRVEIGNTNLTLPGNQFVSFAGRQQGLFGAKMEGKAGNLDFTVVASKQEGRTDRESFVGQSSERTMLVPDHEYEKNRIFWISRDPAVDQFPFSVGTLRVYLDDQNGANNTETGAIPARAHLDADTTKDFEQDGKFFEELRIAEDYSVNRELGILVMNRRIIDSEVLAVAYTYFDPLSGDSVEVGFVPPPAEVSEANPAILKLIKPVNPDPNLEGAEVPRLRVTWRYQLRNVYDLHTTGIQPEGFAMRIIRLIPGQDPTDVQIGTTYLRVFGLDNIGAQVGSPPDDRIDRIYADCNANIPWRELLLVDYEHGLIYFPGEQPFDPLPGQEVLMCADADSLRERNSAIYGKRYSLIKSTDQKFAIEVRLRGAGSSTLSLGRANILEESETVRLELPGQPPRVLTRGVDYTVNYDIGLIEFRTEEAKAADAKISVDFEYAPFLAQQQKSLVGLAGTYRFTPDTDLSTIVLYESNRTPYRRPRLGQEPSRAIVGGLAGQWRASPSFLTGLVNALPLVSTERPSNLAISAEAATSFPNPNTRNNIYVDDMEGTEETSNMGVGRRQWSYPSVPRPAGGAPLLNSSDRFRRIEWYNPLNAARRGDLNPDLEQQSPDEARNVITVLEVGLHGGTQNDSLGGLGAWGGVMRLLSKTGIDYSRRKFIEVWMNDFDRRRGKMHIDLGTISEDAMWERSVPPNGTLDTEDKNNDLRLDDSGQRGPNDEDTGLDGQFNEAEPTDPDRPPTPAGCENELTDDVAGDNYCYDREDSENDYSYINGTENNGYLDTEDLNGNLSLDMTESYLHYVIDLDPMVDSVAAFGKSGWRLYRIPLADGEAAAGAPQLDRDIKSVRFWFSDLDTTDARFQIASIDIVGNRWIEGPILSGVQATASGDTIHVPTPPDSVPKTIAGYGLFADTTAAIGSFSVRVIDNKTGEDYQSPPIEVRTVNGVAEREQALVLDFEDLAARHSAYASKDLFQDEDYSRYATLDFWYQTRSKIGGDPWVFLRFGSDSLNFYEYRTPLIPGAGWQEVFLDLAELTRVKLKPAPDDTATMYRPTTRQPIYALPVANGEVAAVGSPTLTRIGLILFGIVNRSADSTDVTSGEVWVNELSLSDVRKDPGLAERVSVTAELADLASVTADLRRVDDEFQSLGGRRSGSINTSLSLGGNVNLHKFVEPTNLSLPFTWGWSASKSLPELKTGSDVVLLDREDERTENTAIRAGLSIARSKRSENALVYHTLDAMSFRINGSRNRNYSPTRIDSTDSYGFGFQYSLRPRKPKELHLIRSLRVALFPSNIGFTASKDQSNTISVDRRVLAAGDTVRAAREVQTRGSRSQVTVDASPVTSKSITTRYGFSTSRDHSREENGEVFQGVNWGLEVGRTQTANVTFVPVMPRGLGWVAPNVSYDTQYTEAIPFELERRDSLSGELERPRNVRNQNTSKLSVNLNVTRLFAVQPRRGDADTTGGGLNPLAGIGVLGRRLTDIRTSVSVTRASGFDRISDRPGLEYQFGLTDFVEDELRDRPGPGRQERFDQTRNITGNASGGVQLWKGINVTGDYGYSERRALQSRNSAESRAITWPDLNLSWGNFERFRGLERVLESADLNVGYQIVRESSGPDLHNPDKESTRKEWAPLLSVSTTFNSGLRTRLNATRSTAIGESRLGGGTRDETAHESYQVGFEYRIKTARKVSVPILGRGEPTTFTSELGLFLDLNYGTARNVIKGRAGQPDNVTNDTSDWSISPHANYSFSRNVSGTLEAKYGQSNNHKNENYSRRTIRLAVSATMQF
jgi:hypothetical protein